MKRVLLAVIVVLLLGAAAVAGAFWYFVLRAPQPASGPMTAMPVSTAAPVQGAGLADRATGSTTVFHIVPGQSEARFTLGEILGGAPNTVVGTTDQVAGEIAVNPNEPKAARVGTIQVNARGLATDNGMRNRAIQNRILESNTYEFITFTPTAIDGLPDKVAVGQEFSFRITGDLTIRDVTKQVVFDVQVTPVSQDRLEGLASATINRSDFRLTIPQVPRVAGVDEKVLLELQFVATPQG